MAEMDLDLTDFTKLAADLRTGEVAVALEVRAIVQRGALIIKKQMQKDIGSSPHFGAVARDISYTTKITVTGIEAEIGPETGRGPGHSGGMAGFAAFGTSTMGPQWDYAAPLEAEGKVVEGLLLKVVTSRLL